MAFEQLKKKLAEGETLAYFNKNVHKHTRDCIYEFGWREAVLVQKQTGSQRYCQRKWASLKPRAPVFADGKWDYDPFYLYGIPFEINTDHKPREVIDAIL